MALHTNLSNVNTKNIFIIREMGLLVQKETLLLPSLVQLNYYKEISMVDLCFYEDTHDYIVAFLKEDSVEIEDYDFKLFREVFALEAAYASLSARARAIVKWKLYTNFCPTCATLLKDCIDETALECSVCNKRFYPNVTPAIIVQVYKEKLRLLAQHAKRSHTFYTCLAGYVEPGETLEECVKREVKEEVGIEVTNIRYIKSQPWPFPHQLMFGFTCDWLSGEIEVDKAEIEHADWYSSDSLPPIPPRGTIANYLITLEKE